MKLEVGQKAPDFSLPEIHGKTIVLSELLGQNIVLVFFPLAWTPV
jgi:peroxiredoxin (alkyl hydroperoxide reductase subunit C)